MGAEQAGTAASAAPGDGAAEAATPTADGPSSSDIFVLGLTGSIGMGKSTVSAMFRDEGVPVWDADATVHRLYSAGGAAVPPVEAAFPGVTAPDGSIDRAALSKYVVGDEAAMRRLESIVHPLVAADRAAFLQQAAAAAPTAAATTAVVVLDIPLLYETGGPERHGVAGVAVVSAPPELQRARVLSRPGMSEAKLEAILGRQVPDAEKRRRADVVIDTGADLETTREQVAVLVAALRAGRAAAAAGAAGAGPTAAAADAGRQGGGGGG